MHPQTPKLLSSQAPKCPDFILSLFPPAAPGYVPPQQGPERGGLGRGPGGAVLATPAKPAERGGGGLGRGPGGVALATSYKCLKCEVKINDWKLYLDHFTITHLWFDGMDIPCKCGHKAKNAKQFEEHIRSVHGHEFKCEKCDFVATSVSNLSKHKEDRKKEKSAHSCKSCSFVFCTNGNLKDHISNNHPEFSSNNLNESPIVANQKKSDGFREISNAGHVKNNSSVNFQEKPKQQPAWSCNFCFNTEVSRPAFAQKDDLLKHIKEAHPTVSLTSTTNSGQQKANNVHKGQNSVKTLKCALCDMIFPHPNALKFHMNNVHNGQGVNIKKELSTTKNRGILHEANTPIEKISVHEGIKNVADRNGREISKSVEAVDKPRSDLKKLFKCWNCAEICSNQDNHDCTKGKSYVCDHCDFKHLEIKNFLTHVTKNHPGLAIPCHLCKSKSKTVNTFRIHVSGVHTRNYQCDKCDSKYGKALDLKKHKERQTNEPLHACQYCGFVSCKKDALTVHVRIVHGNGKLNVVSQKIPIPKDIALIVDNGSAKEPVILTTLKSTPTALKSTPPPGM